MMAQDKSPKQFQKKCSILGRHLRAILGPSWKMSDSIECFKDLLEQHWSNVAPFWPNQPHLECTFRALLAQLGAVLGSLVSLVGLSWVVLGLLGPSRGCLGLSLGCLGLSWGSLGSFLGPSWGCLGSLLCALGAALGSLGALLGSLGHLGPIKANLGSILAPILGSKIYTFLVIVGLIFLITFWSLFGPLLALFWSSFWEKNGPRRGQDEPRRAVKSFKEQKICIFKNIGKPLVFSRFSGSKGLPREPQEAQEGSQEAPKELQNLKKTASKNGPKK